ncbi:MAG: hypothetical protein JKY14_10325 [Paraglaciecola sp.]|nr:hypothetical protein [Paraglaciecola sp.]
MSIESPALSYQSVAEEKMALASLYNENNRWLTNWLRHKIGCAHDAEDVSQDTFIRVIRSQQDIFAIQRVTI